MMPNLPVRRPTEGQAVSRRTANEVADVRERALVTSTELQAIEYVTAQGQRAAVGIALDETLAGQIAPHAIERFRLIAEAGTQAVVLKIMAQGRG